MGSSMVITWALRVEFTWSTIQASVVVLPLPAGPVNSTRPLGQEAKAITLSGMPSFSRSGRVKETTRITRPRLPRWRRALTRKRESPGTAKEKSSSPVSARRSISRSPARW